MIIWLTLPVFFLIPQTYSHRLRRLSAYDPENQLINYREEAHSRDPRPFRPHLAVVLAKEARTTTINGKEIPLWLGDGFVRIPKRPVVSSVARRVPSSAESKSLLTTTFPPVVLTIGPGPTARPRDPYEAEPALYLPSRFQKYDKDVLIVFKKKKRHNS
uniref:Secreted protein n=1 Tax=Heterorhabditis bacteriophora TaxID=37862 RepID=A0A1I7WVP0_HETBA